MEGTKSISRIYSIDYIRAFACLCVMYSHTMYGKGFGAVAINYFFVISGYVIMLSTEKNQDYFWKKRIVKILPLYYIMTIFTAILVKFVPQLFNSYEVSLEYLIKSLLFIPYTHSGICQPILGVGWTLNYELFFYLIFWLSMKISYKKRGIIASIVLIALGVSGYFFRTKDINPISFWCNSYLVEFAYGIGLFMICNKRRTSDVMKINRFLNIIFLVISIISVIVMTYIREFLCLNKLSILEGLINGIICMIILLCALKNSQYLPKINFLLWISGMSYQMYLIHIYPIRFIDVLFKKIGMKSNVFISIIGMIITLIFCYFYQKAEAYIKKYWKGRSLE